MVQCIIQSEKYGSYRDSWDVRVMSHLKESAVPRYCRDQERGELKSVFRRDQVTWEQYKKTTHQFVLVARKGRMQ